MLTFPYKATHTQYCVTQWSALGPTPFIPQCIQKKIHSCTWSKRPHPFLLCSPDWHPKNMSLKGICLILKSMHANLCLFILRLQECEIWGCLPPTAGTLSMRQQKNWKNTGAGWWGGQNCCVCAVHKLQPHFLFLWEHISSSPFRTTQEVCVCCGEVLLELFTVTLVKRFALLHTDTHTQTSSSMPRILSNIPELMKSHYALLNLSDTHAHISTLICFLKKIKVWSTQTHSLLQ